MIRELATVVYWQNGIALVSCNNNINSCSYCVSHCCSSFFSEGKQTIHSIYIRSAQPLVAGQKIELCITEGRLIGYAMLMYISPLVGLFIMAGLLNMLFNTDIATMIGAIIGFIEGLLLAKACSHTHIRISFTPIK